MVPADILEEWKRGYKKGDLVQVSGLRGVGSFQTFKNAKKMERIDVGCFKAGKYKDVQYNGRKLCDYGFSAEIKDKCSFYIPVIPNNNNGSDVLNDLEFSNLLKYCLPYIQYEAQRISVVQSKVNVFKELSVLPWVKRYLDVDNIRELELPRIHACCGDYFPDGFFSETQQKIWKDNLIRERGDKTRMLCETSNHSGLRELFGSYLSVIDPNVFEQSSVESHAKMNIVSMNGGEEYECCDIWFHPSLLSFKLPVGTTNSNDLNAEVIHRVTSYKDKTTKKPIYKTNFFWKFAFQMKRLRDLKTIKITFSSTPTGFVDDIGSLFRCQYLGLKPDPTSDKFCDTTSELLALMRYHLPYMTVMIHSPNPEIAHFLREKDSTKNNKPNPNRFVAGYPDTLSITEDQELERKLTRRCEVEGETELDEENWMDLFIQATFRFDLDDYLDRFGIPVFGPPLLFDAYRTMGATTLKSLCSPKGSSHIYHTCMYEPTKDDTIKSTFSEVSYRWNNLAQAVINKEFPIDDFDKHADYEYVALFSHHAFYLDQETDQPRHSLSDARRQFIDQWILGACPLLKKITSMYSDAVMNITDHFLGIKKFDLKDFGVVTSEDTSTSKITIFEEFISKYHDGRAYRTPSDFSIKNACVIFFRPKKSSSKQNTSIGIGTGIDVFQAKKPDPASFLNISNLKNQDLKKPLPPIVWDIELFNHILNPLNDNQTRNILGKRKHEEEEKDRTTTLFNEMNPPTSPHC